MVNSGMGDRLQARKPRQYFTKPPRPTQLPTLGGMGNKYWPKYGDAVRLRSKARMAHSICGWTCGWQVKLCDPSLTHAVPECFRDEYCTHCKVLYKCPVHVTLLIYSPFIWNMRWRAPDQEVDQRGHGKRLCKRIAKHIIWTRRMLWIVVDWRIW